MKRSSQGEPSVTFLPSGKTVKIGKSQSLLDVALSGAVALDHVCGGMASCGTCRLFVETAPQPVPERNSLEQEMATMRTFAENERLACQTPPQAGMVVRIPVSRKIN